MNSRQQITKTLTRGGASLVRRMFLDRQAAFWLESIDPVQSAHEIRARVVEVIAETEDTRTFVLQPNRHWAGHRAGQFTSVEVEIDGVRARRCYSISSAPAGSRGTLSITVKRVPGGRVSQFLHDHVRAGHIVRLSPAAGEFILPTSPGAAKLLLLSGGCGITPVMSMLRHMAKHDALNDVVLVHHARRQADVIFGEELADLTERHAGLRIVLCLDDDADTPPGFDEDHFATLVPDFAARTTYLCGPAPMMDRAEDLWSTAGAPERLHSERFVSALTPPRPVGSTEGVEVRLARSERFVVARGGGTLLEQLERAGERPPNGCRIGICHTCKCRKKRGTVKNLVTGELSSEPDQEIQLCISTPHSDLELEL